MMRRRGRRRRRRFDNRRGGCGCVRGVVFVAMVAVLTRALLALVFVNAADTAIGFQAVRGAFERVPTVDDAFGRGLEGSNPAQPALLRWFHWRHPVWVGQGQEQLKQDGKI